MSLGKPEYVSDLVVYLLNRLGVEYVTLNPGATTRSTVKVRSSIPKRFGRRSSGA